MNEKKINPNPFQNVIRIIELKSGVILGNLAVSWSVALELDCTNLTTQSLFYVESRTSG